jgi:hypothetical protein
MQMHHPDQGSLPEQVGHPNQANPPEGKTNLRDYVDHLDQASLSDQASLPDQANHVEEVSVDVDDMTVSRRR